MTQKQQGVPTGIVAVLLVLGMFILGFAVGRSGRTDPSRADGARHRAELAAFKVAHAAGVVQGRANGKAAGASSGRKAGHVAGKHAARKRVKRDLANGTATPPTTTSPYTDQNGSPAPNPNCPAGQEPTPGGGCAPYNDQNGQLEPKINDPDCYKPDPPAGCF